MAYRFSLLFFDVLPQFQLFYTGRCH